MKYILKLLASLVFSIGIGMTINYMVGQPIGTIASGILGTCLAFLAGRPERIRLPDSAYPDYNPFE